MLVSFENQSSQAIRLTLRGNAQVLSSGQIAVLELDNQEPIYALVDQYKPLRKKDKTYRLVVETEYRLDGLTDGCRILLTREHIAIDVNMSYDRVFLHPTAGQIAEEKYQVVNHPHVKKQIHKNELAKTALWEPLWDILGELLLDLIFHPFATLLCIAIAVGIGIYFGWYWIPIILLGTLILNGLINIVISPAIEKMIAKTMGVPTEMQALAKHCTPAYLSNFYSQAERHPFGSKPIEH